jgi:hypothetical protein
MLPGLQVGPLLRLPLSSLLGLFLETLPDLKLGPRLRLVLSLLLSPLLRLLLRPRLKRRLVLARCGLFRRGTFLERRPRRRTDRPARSPFLSTESRRIDGRPMTATVARKWLERADRR